MESTNSQLRSIPSLGHNFILSMCQNRHTSSSNRSQFYFTVESEPSLDIIKRHRSYLYYKLVQCEKYRNRIVHKGIAYEEKTLYKRKNTVHRRQTC